MILTREAFKELNACVEGYETALRTGNVGKDIDEVISYCNNNNLTSFADWLIEQKKTEYYVRNNGSILTMGAYQVFNPLTGTHTRYETEVEAKAALVEIAKEVLNQHCPTVVQELSNENGDTTWIPTTMNETLVVS